MNKCEKCIHNPICEWIESNGKEFTRCIHEESSYILFHEEKETNCTNFDHTIEMMLSSDYKERFKAEYYQTKTRYEKLKKFNTKIEASSASKYTHNPVGEPKHDCPNELLKAQERAMDEYLHILEIRAVIEGIEL